MPPVEGLRELIAEGRIVVVVGSGVSRAVSGGEEVASWNGLLKNGVRKCREADPRLDNAWEQRVLGAIDSPDLDEILGAAELISRKLNAPEGGAFAGWLRETVGTLQVRHPELLHALSALGAPLVTTNYDGLLEKVTKLPAITWQDEGKVSRMLERAEDSAAVFHVHGYWDQPKSVVLGIRSYEEVRLAPHTQAVLRALAMTQSLLFVGCGDGLRDPNFGPFLSWLSSVNRSRETPHYRLGLEKDVVGLVQEHPADQRIQIVSYGKGHGDLLGFLQRLAPRASSTAIHAVSSTIELNETLETLHPAVGAYLQRLAVRVSKLQLLGLGRGIQITLPIQEAYVPLRTAVTRQFEERRPGHSKDPLVAGGEYCEREIELARMFEVAAGSGHQGVLLLGDPGAGKTTGARQFCWRLLHRAEAGDTPGLPAGCVPVFLRLRDLTPALLSRGLKAFIAEQVQSDALPEGEAQPGPELIALRNALWIFDGLDEVVSEEARVHVCGLLRRWLEDRPKDWVLVTSRYQGYQGEVDLGPEFCRFHVQPLSVEQSAEFVRRWYRTVYRRLNPSDRDAETRGTKEAEALLGLLSESAYRIGGLRDLPSNPLFLTILCLVHHEDHSLPRKRTDVYARCVRVLLESWRQETRQTQGVASFDPEVAERVLGSLAWWLHEEENRTSATVGELGVEAGRTLAEVSASSGLGRDGEAFVRRMRDESGILAMSGSGRCGFLHLTFQEYLAGAHAAREGLAGTLAKRMGSSWWREAILVALAVGSRAFAKEFFDQILDGDVTQWDVTLIDQCLGEAAVVPSEPFVKVLKDPRISGDRKLAILRRLRTVEVSGLTEACQEMAAGKDRELAAVALELLQRSGGISFRASVARSPGPLESFVDPKTGIAYVTLPAGEFNMGSENGRDWEKPVHRVRLSPFAIGKYPVTNAEFGRFLAANPGHPPPRFWKDSQFNDPQQPVVGVLWSNAQAFCQWAGAQLPTEAQWEYACRAGSTGEYFFGDEESRLGEYAWFSDNSGGRTHTVGEKVPNAWGLHDMHGNVWEWCDDAWDPVAYRKTTAGTLDPCVTGKMAGDKNLSRLIRGGSFGSNAPGCRSASRIGCRPGFLHVELGFRVCLILNSAEQSQST